MIGLIITIIALIGLAIIFPILWLVYLLMLGLILMN